MSFFVKLGGLLHVEVLGLALLPSINILEHLHTHNDIVTQWFTYTYILGIIYIKSHMAVSSPICLPLPSHSFLLCPQLPEMCCFSLRT